MQQCDLILTDSGGIQEEAYYLSKPMIVLRNTTERKEGLDSDLVQLGGTQGDEILVKIKSVLSDSPDSFTNNDLVYGDGNASRRIISFIEDYFTKS